METLHPSLWEKNQVGIESRLLFLQMTQEETSANVGTSEMG